MTAAPMTKPKHLKPAALAAARFGNYRIMAARLGDQPNVVWRWIHKSGGGIPWKRQAEVLAAAKRCGITLTADELIHGGVP